MEAFREATGIRPLSGEAAKFVKELQSVCLSTALMLENELSGIRDGNGYWQGSDIVGGLCEDLAAAAERVWRGIPKGREDIEFRCTEYQERLTRMAIEAGILPEPDDFADMAEDFEVYTDAEIAELAEQSKAA